MCAQTSFNRPDYHKSTGLTNAILFARFTDRETDYISGCESDGPWVYCNLHGQSLVTLNVDVKRMKSLNVDVKPHENKSRDSIDFDPQGLSNRRKKVSS